jgi:hypothetical protein
LNAIIISSSQTAIYQETYADIIISCSQAGFKTIGINANLEDSNLKVIYKKKLGRLYYLVMATATVTVMPTSLLEVSPTLPSCPVIPGPASADYYLSSTFNLAARMR